MPLLQGTTPARVTVIQEVIISKNQGDQPPGLLKIKHNDHATKDIEIKLPLTKSRKKELQEQDPLVGRLRKQWSEKKLDKKHFTMENEILKKKTVINCILYTPTVVHTNRIYFLHPDKIQESRGCNESIHR